MCGADTLKSRASSRTGESTNASSGLRCASGRNAFLGHVLIALITFSLFQEPWSNAASLRCGAHDEGTERLDEVPYMS